MLGHQYMLDIDSDSLLKIGEAQLEKYRKLYDEYSAKIDSNGSEVDSVFVIDCLTKENILDYYNWETEQTKLFLKEKDLVTIPEDIGLCEVVETPPFLRGMISSIAYNPPGVFSPVQKGLFYVRPIPENMDEDERAARYRYIHRRGFKGSVVHEAYPGHHLQFQMASRLDNDVRKWQECAMFYEGWALYCEEMMYHQGFYGDDLRRFQRVIGGILFRAARIIADVKLHTGEFTRDEALKWFTNVMDEPETSAWVAIEIDRYTVTPTIPMSYLIGKLEIMKILDDVKEIEGDNFSLKNFHDRLLAVGSLPPKLIWDIWDLEK
jgi:hypothetical protein